MKKKILLVVTLLLITACSIPVLPIQVVPSPTANVVEPTKTPVVVLPTDTQIPTPTFTATVTPSPLPTFTPTPSVPLFTVDTDSNCRSGPSKEYQILEGIYTGESVQILGQSTPERAKWWYVQKNGTNCWVSGILGTTSGNLISVPFITAPPIPTPTHILVKTLFENNTEGNICSMYFYVGIDIVAKFTWNKGEFKNDGMDMKVFLPIGGYDLIEAYNCKSELVTTLTDVEINQDNNAFSLK